MHAVRLVAAKANLDDGAVRLEAEEHPARRLPSCVLHLHMLGSRVDIAPAPPKQG